MMTRVAVTDFVEGSLLDELDEELAALDFEFSKWENAAGEGTRQLWSVLGKVYELGSEIEANGTAKARLIASVNADPNVQESPNWIAEKKASHELLLVKLLSLKPETKATKSQWFSAIRAAKKAETRTTQADFIAYLENVGGIDNARRSIAQTKKRPPTLEELAGEFAYETDAPKFQAPDIYSETKELPFGFGLVLVRGDKAGGPVVPIDTVVDAKLIEKAMLKVQADEKSYRREITKELNAERAELVKKLRKDLRSRYRKYMKSSKSKKHPAEFGEFVYEQQENHIDLINAVERHGDGILQLIVDGCISEDWLSEIPQFKSED